MMYFERQYCQLVELALTAEKRQTRNAVTHSLFGQMLSFYVGKEHFPLLTGRRMYPQGVLGELAAMLRRPTNIADFKKWGCNYWDAWGDEQGNINVDYGNAWFDFNGVDQIAELKRCLREDPTNRRMMISGWRPDRLTELSLPCCHYNYQFYVTNRGELNMLWSQRSVDIMVGLPSDIIFAAAWLIAIANEFGLTPGMLHFAMGDCHIYEQHIAGAHQYLHQVWTVTEGNQVSYRYLAPAGEDFCKFDPKNLVLAVHTAAPAIKFELVV